MSFYSEDELASLGFRRLGASVRISRKASFHNAAAIEVGDFSRIDDFCLLSANAGGIAIGRHVHVAAYSSLIGEGRIALRDFSGLSAHVSVYSSSDDYSGATMTNPTVPAEARLVTSAPVTVGRHVIVGAGSVILPGVTLHEGAGVGALSLVREDCAAFTLYAGAPARPIGRRSTGMMALEKRLFPQVEA